VLRWTALGAALAMCMHFEMLPPVKLSVCVLALTALWGLWSIDVTRRSLLPRFMVLLYVLPFSACAGYLFDQEYIWWDTPIAARYCQDPGLISGMLMLGAVGLLGLLAGIDAAALLYGGQQEARAGTQGVRPLVPGSTDRESMSPLTRPMIEEQTPGRQPTLLAPSTLPANGAGQPCTLGLLAFLGLLGVSVFLSQLAAPRATIFEAGYATIDQGGAVANEVNFGSSFLISYIILLLLYADAEREPTGSAAQRFKWRAVLLAAAYIVIVLQLLRGDRESSGLVAALAALYLTRGHGRGANLWRNFVRRRRVVRFALLAAVCLPAFLLLGFIRSTAHESAISVSDMKQVMQRMLTENTWTAVSLTNLGLAAEAHYQRVEFLGGETYMQYVYSLPPGIVTNWLGVERPLESFQGPSWWYSHVSCGGIHPVCVPYKNFGLTGVFLVLALFGGFISACEQSNRAAVLSSRVWYGTVWTCSFLWFWYGDMTIIRGAMAAVILLVFYRLAARPQHSVVSGSDAPMRPHLGNRSTAARIPGT
jgi:hypothetical protein